MEQKEFFWKMRDEGNLSFVYNGKEFNFETKSDLQKFIDKLSLRQAAARVNARNKEYMANYYQEHKAERTAYKYIWSNKPENKIKEKIRNAPRLAIQAKKDKYNKILGCLNSEFKNYIESLFVDGMSWENYKELWVFDHIIPICEIDIKSDESIKELGNYKNVQPVLKMENWKKSDKNNGTRDRIRRWKKIDNVIEVAEHIKNELEYFSKNKNDYFENLDYIQEKK